MASIFIMTGNQKGSYYPLGQRTSVIGRDEALLIQILDEHVSRKHMQIHFDPNEKRYHAFDMKSKHGLFVNGKKTSGEIPLADGDQILIGQTTLLFSEKDFDDHESALSHFKKVGERMRPTVID